MKKSSKWQKARKLVTKKSIALLLWTACSVGVGYGIKSSTGGTTQPNLGMMIPELPVLTGQPIQKDIRPFKNFIALVEPVNEVDLKPEVSGTVDAVLFENGAFVNEGDELFIIDKSRYEANVQSAKATLAKAEANLKQLENDYKRQKKLFSDKFVAKAELEVAESNLAQAHADVDLAQSKLQLAEIDLKRATITAPISGYISKAFVTKGNFVSSATASLARIVQTNPVRISFSVTDKERLQKVINQAKTSDLFDMKLVLANGEERPVRPEKVFTDNEVDQKTATLAVYVEYANENRLLLPGNILTVRLSDTQKQEAILVPTDAVMQDADGRYVMKVLPDGTALQQYIDTDSNIENYFIVDKGLTTRDTIILSGAQKVRSGQKIKSIAPNNAASTKPVEE